MTQHAQWLVEFDYNEDDDYSPQDIQYWSGEGLLNYDGKIYNSVGKIIGLSGAELKEGIPDQRLQINMFAGDPTIRELLLQDHGPIELVVKWIYSNDNGVTWNKIPAEYRGRLSNPRIENGVYHVELETVVGDIDAGETVYFSDEYQRDQDAEDVGYEYLKEIAAGKEIRWPP